MRLRTVPFEPHHVDEIKLKSVFLGETHQMKRRIAACVRSPGTFSTSVISPKGPIAVLAISLIHSKAAEAWSVMGEDVKDYPIEFARLVLRLIENYEKHLGLHRVQIIIKEGHPELERWVSLLGCQKEGLLRGYGQDGANYFIYARVRKWQ